MNKSTTDALDIANWFIARANREKVENFGEGISNLKLQKIVYFAQAAHLALENDPLFNDEIYAWNYGPVIDNVYHQFKGKDKTPIANPSNNEYQQWINPATSEFLEDVWQLFGKYSAGKLVEMTHAHDPWKKTYDGSPNKVIPKDMMQQYYESVFVRT